MRYAEIVFNLPLKKSFIYFVPDDMRFGCRVLAPFGNRKIMGCVIKVKDKHESSTFKIKDIYSVIDNKPVLSEKIYKLAEWMSRVYMCSLGEALFTILPGARKEKEESIDILIDEEIKNNFELTGYQEKAIDAVLNPKTNNVFYVQGVTGSGKTEVFLQVAKSFVERDKDIIYLVPEISLVHQVVEYFILSFKDKISVLHSGMTSSQRLKTWRKIQENSGNVVIGVRSAVFAPVKKLGLIVLDEEHESTYKSNSTPRYHARQVAAYRCKKEQAALVMGSATPSLDAYYRMCSGEIEKLELPERIGIGALPEIKIIDMKKEKGLLSKELIKTIKSVYKEKRQSILFLNRRGFAYLFFCRSCGFEMKCKNCSVSLTFHKNKKLMMCHYCGYKVKPVGICPDCGSLDIGYSGFGTQRVEEDVKKLFPDLKISRIDTDTVRNKKRLRKILIDFKNGSIDLLLGTQMVAKGLNFPGVKLVGIVLADLGLQLPDFKAFERTFSLITQVSGRAGRITKDGLVIVQTFKPKSGVIQMASRMKIAEFYKQEMSSRRALRFPPFVRIIRIVIRGKKKEQALKMITDFAKTFQKFSNTDIELLGPVECPISVIAGNHRYNIVFRGNDFLKIHNIVSKSVNSFILAKDTYLEVDVDPVSLL